jgi:hypothetical protein
MQLAHLNDMQNYMRNIALTAICLFALIFSGCDEDPEITAPIVGKWAGAGAEFKINPTGIIPAFKILEDDLPVVLEFKADNKLILTDKKGVNTTGTYVLSGDQLTINIAYTFELIDIGGVYSLKELTNTTLSAETTRQGSYTHPDTGQQFDGEVTATLNFSKSTN